MISAENVIVTILVNDSWKNIMVPNIMTQPLRIKKIKLVAKLLLVARLTWNNDLKNQIKNVLTERDLPFCSVA